MADANPSSPAKKAPKEVKDPSGPRIEFLGEGAEKVKFTVDPKATHIRVYADGRILTDY